VDEDFGAAIASRFGIDDGTEPAGEIARRVYSFSSGDTRGGGGVSPEWKSSEVPFMQ
jgi:hypothetical protein